MQKKEQCFQCKKVPDNIIVLECDHSLCLNCCSNCMQQTLSQQQFIINCLMCGQSTVIDIPLYLQIQQMTTTTKEIQIPNRNRITFMNAKQNHQQNKQNQKHNVIENQYFQHNCSYHPQCTIMYICRDCCNNLICPQCVVNGIHKNHIVISIQKESQKIKQQLTSLLNTLDNTSNLQYIQNQNMIESIQNNKAEVQMLRNKTRNKYQQIVQMIMREQNQISLKCDEIINCYERQINLLLKNKERQMNFLQQKRIDILDILNPFMKENMINPSKILLKWHSITMIKQYEIFNRKYDQQTINQNFFISCSNTKEKKNINRSVIDEIDKKINKISLDNYKNQANRIRMNFQDEFIKQKQKIRNKKIYVIEQKRQNINSNKLSMIERKTLKNNSIFNLI